MGRPKRDIIPDGLYHVVTKVNRDEFHFRSLDDVQPVIDATRCAKKKLDFKVLDLMPMSNHVHMLIQVGKKTTISQVMHRINWLAAVLINKRHGWRGHFWRERYRDTVVTSEAHALAVLGYLADNPFRSSVGAEGWWRRLGYRFHVLGERGGFLDVLDPLPGYLANAARGMAERLRRVAFIARLRRFLGGGNGDAGGDRVDHVLPGTAGIGGGGAGRGKGGNGGRVRGDAAAGAPLFERMARLPSAAWQAASLEALIGYAPATAPPPAHLPADRSKSD
jgi:REP element-mobilizing transposase RayT